MTETREQAIQEARNLDPWRVVSHVASFRAADGYRAYAARTEREAYSWLNFNRGYMHVGSDRIDPAA